MEYMFINKPEFAEPIRVFFLCGSKFNDIDSDKRIVLKKQLESNPVNKVILLEKYFSFSTKTTGENGLLSYYDAELFNLHSIETFAALVSTNVIIIHETLSTAGEIGVFASNEDLRDRIITLVPDKHSVEEDKLSNFLRLAFWNPREQLVNNKVIRFSPQTKLIKVSKSRAYFETYFQNNVLPEMLNNRINGQLNTSPRSAVCAFGDGNYRFEKGSLSVWLSCSSIKNYIMAILSIPSIREKLRKCTKLYEIRNIITNEFSNALKTTFKDASTYNPVSVNIFVDKYPNYKFDTLLNFMIYFLHACKIMPIKCQEDGTMSVSFSKNTSFLWKQYSLLIKQVSFADWGE